MTPRLAKTYRANRGKARKPKAVIPHSFDRLTQRSIVSSAIREATGRWNGGMSQAWRLVPREVK